MRKLLLVLPCLLLTLGLKVQPSPQTKEITRKFFPDPEIEIPTPAFQKKRGFTSYDEMMVYVRNLVQSHPDVAELTYIGNSQKGKQIPLVRIRKNQGAEKLRVWIQGGLHGNEPGSTEGVLYLMDRLLNDPASAYLLNKLELAIVPMANIDGCEKLDRYAANGLDLNRDQTKLAAPESVVLKQTFSDYKAHVALDFHEYRPYRRDFAKLSTFGVTNGFDVMFLYSGNLNVPENLRNYTKETFVSKAGQVLDSNGLTHHEYFSESKVMGGIEFHQGSLNSRSSATSYALANTISSLIEIRGIGLGRTSFKRRVYSTFLVAQSYLRTAYENAEEVRNVLKLSSKDRADAVVKSKSRISEQPLELIDLETAEKIVLQVRMREAWFTTATLSRQRPTAYLILPEHHEVAKKLEVLGLKVDQLTEAKKAEVEKYTVLQYQQDAVKYEGVNRQTVSTALEKVEKEFPTGTFIVRMDQPRANLVVEVLEPEAANSFVGFDVLHTSLNAELPVYRYLKKETF